MGLAGNGDLALFHGLEQCRLHLGGRAVDLIGQDDIGENGARLEHEALGGILAQVHLRAGNIGGQKIRRELDAAEIRFQVLRQALHRAGLGQARQALDEDIAVAQQGQQQALHDLLLADDGTAHALHQFVYPLACIHVAASRFQIEDHCKRLALRPRNISAMILHG